MNNEQIAIRSIQHYLYCPHRWGLMEIGCAWAENYFVSKANLIHERVHTTDDYSIRGKNVFTAVRIWNDEYGLVGEVDCLEEKNGLYTIVEYKPTEPSDNIVRYDDLMQIFAQKICVDSVFHCDCDAVIYYANTKKRIVLTTVHNDCEQLKYELKSLLGEMKNLKLQGKVPMIKKGQNCNGCSMKDMCIPSTKKCKAGIRQQIQETLEENQI